MAEEGMLRVEAAGLGASGESLGAAAELLLGRLKELDGQVQNMLGSWQGCSGGAYCSAWELWRRGAAEVEVGLSIMARLVAHAGVRCAEREAQSAEALGGVVDG
jgi:uncharacterized protein YukE